MQAKDRNKALSQEDGNMTDCVVNKEDAFVYTYSAQKSKEIEKIRSKYLPKEETIFYKGIMPSGGRKIFCVYGKNSSLIRNRYV